MWKTQKRQNLNGQQNCIEVALSHIETSNSRKYSDERFEENTKTQNVNGFEGQLVVIVHHLLMMVFL